LVVTEVEHVAFDEETPGQGGLRVIFADVLEV